MDRKEKALLVAVGANLFLVFFKFFLADISGSVALRMSGWHSVEGLFVSLAVFTGFIISRKEMGRFTKGISTVENVVALLISLFVFFIAYRVFVKMARPHVHMLTNVPLVTLGAILGAMICYFMARLKIYVGQQCKSPSLVADGYHCRIHVLMEIAVVVGLAGYLIGFHNLDMLMAMVVLLFVLYTGFQLFTTALVSLTSKVSADYSCHIAHDTGRRLSSRTVLILSSVILAIYLSSGFYIIRWNEEGLIRRFGKEVARGIPPGLHYRLPWPIEVVDKVKVKDVRKLDTGTLLMLTGDENLINLKISVHYAVKEAAQFIYNIAAPEDFMREAAHAAVRDVIGGMAVDSLLTVTKSTLQESTKVLSQQMLDDWNAGIEVISVQLLQAYPPAEVMESFRDVASAREDRETYINEAYGYLNSIVP
ncbi:MAG: protease modulator HflK family protein, partial [bacterium]